MRRLVRIAPDGVMSFLHDDRLTETIQPTSGTLTIERASRIEVGGDLAPEAVAHLAEPPDPIGWYADLTPSRIPRVLGPYRTRQAAVAAEIDALERHAQHAPCLSPL
jgi:hypothetical protein